MIEMPEHLKKYKSTPVFTERTLPKGLLDTHQTKANTWAKVTVHDGSILYVSEKPSHKCELLTAGHHAIIQPEAPHHLKLHGSVSLQIDFYR